MSPMMSSFSNKTGRLFATKTSRYIAISFFIILCFLLLFKSCSSNSSTTDYRIGQDANWRGLGLMGKERNLTAFNNDLLSTVAKKEQMNIHVTIEAAPKLMADLEQGKLQGVLTTMKPSYINENYLLFSEPYFLLGPVLIIPATAPIEGWNEMAKKIIGMQSNSADILNLEQDPSIQIKVYDDILKALADLSDRRIDGVVFPALPAHIYVKTFYDKELKIATPPLTDDGLRLVTLKNAKGEFLIQKFDQALATFKENGTYNELIERWGLVNVEITKP